MANPRPPGGRPKPAEFGWILEDPPRALKEDEKKLRAEIAKASLGANCGKWGRVATFGGISSAYGRRTRLMKDPEYSRQWEFRAVPIEGGSRLYVKYSGVPTDASTDELERARERAARSQ